MELTITTRAADFAALESPLLVIPVAKGSPASALAAVDALCDGAIGRAMAAGDFTGARDEALLLYGMAGIKRVLLVGLGDADADGSALRRAAMIAGKRARTIGAASVSFAWLPEVAPVPDLARAGQAIAEGLPFGAWHYPHLKRPPETPKPTLAESLVLGPLDAAFAGGVERGTAIAAGQRLTRDLQMQPGNTCTPAHLAATAHEIGTRHGIDVTVLDGERIAAEGMQALLAVAQGSAVDPRFIILEYRGGGDAAPCVLIGKGITFDSGGISIKPAQSMEDMKYDMSGAAAVLGTFETLGRLRPAINVVGLVPSCENMPSGTAVKPGDVIGSHFGKTIEVINTDAEGRLILADALSWARRYKPAAVVDCATLTGAVVIGLGHSATAVLGTDSALINELITAGSRAGERAWELPLWDEYRELIKSDIADVKNTGGRPAGTITAAWFLKEFVEGYPWAHLDIAGTAYSERELPTQVRGPTGVLVRLFTEFLLSRS